MEYVTDLNKLISELDSREPDPSRLVSKNAGESTKRLFDYLKSIYGKAVLAGQQYLQEAELEDDVYFELTGDLPAVRGYDLMDMDKKKGDGQIKRAIRWAKETGAIITLCWHWYAPDDLSDPDNCMWAFYAAHTSYDRKTSFDLLKAVEHGTPEYDFIISRIDKAAAILREFEQEDIPVLFRPLHEANGDWFWWGRRKTDTEASVEAYKKLWYIMFDRLENLHKLSNLIWVWNGQDKQMCVHPNTFDIGGDDIYSTKEHDRSSQKERFDYISEISCGKMTALSECGYIPAVSELKKDKAKWLWWLPWWGSFVYAMGEDHRPILDDSLKPKYNEKYLSPEFLKQNFGDEYCITLSKLPFFKGRQTLPEKFR